MIDGQSIPFPYSQRGGMHYEGSMLTTLWHYVGTPLITLLISATAGLVIKRGVERSTFNQLKDSHDTLEKAMDSLEKAYSLRGQELSSLSEKLGRLQQQFDEQERRFNKVSELNQDLQIQIKQRDLTIVELRGHINLLQSEVTVLQGKLAAIKA